MNPIDIMYKYRWLIVVGTTVMASVVLTVSTDLFANDFYTTEWHWYIVLGWFFITAFVLRAIVPVPEESTLNTFSGKWMPDSADYRQKCLEITAALRDGGNPPFKQDPVYCKYVGNDNRDKRIATLFYATIGRIYPHLMRGEKPVIALKNDYIGEPKMYPFSVGRHISPGSLRFIKVLGDIEDWITKHMVTRIVEIGPGYGGQCKVIKSYYPDVVYTLIDIPEALALAKEYLSRFNIHPSIFSCEAGIPSHPYEICISDYCLGEMDDAGIAFYVDNVIKYCRYGYFTVHDSVVQKVMVHLSVYFELEVQYEEPQTHVKHKNHIIKAYRR